VVTGASSGIGLELAKQFAQHGYDLLIASEDDDIAGAASTLRSFGAQVNSVRSDLGTYEGVEHFYGRIKALGRPVDAIAINVGESVGGRFLETDLQHEIDLITLNVTSVVHLAKRVLTDMAARNEGHVLFATSVTAEAPAPVQAVYAASKAFVLSFAAAVGEELKDTSITVAALQPGATETDFLRHADVEDALVSADDRPDPAEVARKGFEALMAARDHTVVAVMKEKFQVIAGQVMPETFKLRQHGRPAEPGSANP
jgi:short-subunit dehydrogenase